MAKDKEEPESENTEATPDAGSAKKKRLVKFGGGVLGLVAAAFITAVVAAPSKKEYKVFEGPFVASLCPGNVTVNLKGDGSTRFLAFEFEALYDAYDSAYVEQRVLDPIYLSLMKDVALTVGARRTAEEAKSEVGRAAFREELRQSVEPLLFPVQLGKTNNPAEQDPESGLKMGLSGYRSTFRGHLYDGKLHLDGPAHSIRLGRGRPVRFEGTEKDLRVEDENGRFVHVDVSHVEEDFAGDVMVGVHGRIREILFPTWNVQ
ncbi:MAG: hypothetical protein R3F34_05215 [Planctomycetota bacterium]